MKSFTSSINLSTLRLLRSNFWIVWFRLGWSSSVTTIGPSARNRMPDFPGSMLT